MRVCLFRKQVCEIVIQVHQSDLNGVFRMLIFPRSNRSDHLLGTCDVIISRRNRMLSDCGDVDHGNAINSDGHHAIKATCNCSIHGFQITVSVGVLWIGKNVQVAKTTQRGTEFPE